jgi:peptidoglycan-associated lipoprotein
MNRLHLQIIGLCLFLIVAAGAGCKKKTPPPAPPPPPPPAAPAPTATLTVNPTSIERGQSATLEWTTQNATEVTIEPDLGTVPASGSRSVRPTQSTTYRLTAKGEGGSGGATARVTVTAPPPAPTPAVERPRDPTVEEIWPQRIKIIYFDYDKYDIRDDQRAALQSNGDFLRSYSQIRIVVEGHCDERGSAQYNLGLGQRRADSIKEFLVGMGISADRIRTISYGKEKPACLESNEDCWQQNRRGIFVRE